MPKFFLWIEELNRYIAKFFLISLSDVYRSLYLQELPLFACKLPFLAYDSRKWVLFSLLITCIFNTFLLVTSFLTFLFVFITLYMHWKMLS